MLKRGLMIVLFLVLLSSVVSAFAFSKIEPKSFYEGSSQDFKISINNFFQNLTVAQVQINTPGINITDTFAMGWQVSLNGSQARWYGSEIPPNFWGVAIFNFTITGPSVLANKNITFSITKINKDNSTATESHNITILDDTTPPNITSINPLNSTLANTIQTITANVVEAESQLQLVNYTYGDCNGTNTTITLSCNGSICTGTANFTSFNEGDVACYMLYVENNVGGKNTTIGNITFHGIPPNVTAVTPTPGTIYTESEAIYITADVTDDTNVSKVRADITYPNGTTIPVQLSKASGNKYSKLFNAPNLLGQYNVTIAANDTSGNINNSETTNFKIVPDYTFTVSLNPATAKPGRTVIISGTVTLSNGSGIPENKVTIEIQGKATNVSLANNTFSHTFNAPQNPGSYNLFVKVYANNGYNYSASKKLTVKSNTGAGGDGGSSGWGWDSVDPGDDYYYESSGAGEPAETETTTSTTEDAETTEAPQETASQPQQPEEPEAEEVIDEILSKPGNQITGAAVGVGPGGTLLAMLLLIVGLAVLAYSNTRIRTHVHKYAKEKVGGKFKKKAPEDIGFSDEEWEEYFKRLRGED